MLLNTGSDSAYEMVNTDIMMRGSPQEPIHQRFEEEKSDGGEKKSKSKKQMKSQELDYEEDDLVNEIDNFLIEDDDI